MTILKTKADVDTLGELHRRKAVIKAKLDAEQEELKEVWQEVRGDLQPRKIVGRAINSMLGISDQPDNDADDAAIGFASRLKGPLRVATDLLVRDPRVAMLLKVVTPLTIAYLPGLARKAKALPTVKRGVLGLLRKGVTGLRKKLKRNEVNDE